LNLNLLYIEDVVWANKQLLTTAKTDGTVMNIGGSRGISIINLAQNLKEITGSTSEIRFAESQKGDAVFAHYKVIHFSQKGSFKTDPPK